MKLTKIQIEDVLNLFISFKFKQSSNAKLDDVIIDGYLSSRETIIVMIEDYEYELLSVVLDVAVALHRCITNCFNPNFDVVEITTHKEIYSFSREAFEQYQYGRINDTKFFNSGKIDLIKDKDRRNQ